ncbi:MAG TPA: hypothetical protein VHG70_14440 [Nocardioidaceae bacterium]|nr:hypothetical protein [Nocardioidaceae bacterium]
MDSPSGDAHEALRAAALGSHAPMKELLDEVAHARPSSAEPRRLRELTDTFMAITSRHLAAVDDTLLPRARATLTDGHEVVAEYVAQARRLEQALHAMKASMYGDANVRHLHGDELWGEAGTLLEEHEKREVVLVDRLATSLPADELPGLAERLRRSEEHAPTRPHAYTPHTGLLGRLGHRAWAVADRFWDSAEGRVIPVRPRPLHPRRNSLLTRYLLGAPRFDDPERPERDARA